MSDHFQLAMKKGTERSPITAHIASYQTFSGKVMKTRQLALLRVIITPAACRGLFAFPHEHTNKNQIVSTRDAQSNVLCCVVVVGCVCGEGEEGGRERGERRRGRGGAVREGRSGGRVFGKGVCFLEGCVWCVCGEKPVYS